MTLLWENALGTLQFQKLSQMALNVGTRTLLQQRELIVHRPFLECACSVVQNCCIDATARCRLCIDAHPSSTFASLVYSHGCGYGGDERSRKADATSPPPELKWTRAEPLGKEPAISCIHGACTCVCVRPREPYTGLPTCYSRFVLYGPRG